MAPSVAHSKRTVPICSSVLSSFADESGETQIVCSASAYLIRLVVGAGFDAAGTHNAKDLLIESMRMPWSLRVCSLVPRNFR